ncbi:MAG: PepSY domain-containing protein [Chthoniobacterales bacterium]
MKLNYRILLTGVTFAGLTASTLLAGQTEAQLLKEAKISKTQAEQIALGKVPNGKVQNAEIENEHNALVWSFDIVTPGTRSITEVLVDAKTGKIANLQVETPKDQANEAAADKAAAAKK